MITGETMNANTLSNISVWQQYWGALLNDGDSRGTSVLYGFENESEPHQHHSQVQIPDGGACYGFVGNGSLIASDSRVSWTLSAGQWFSLPQGCHLTLAEHSQVVLVQRLAYHGIYAMGGPIETCGRLRYIDGCSDTLLCAPPIQGDPCLNLLHFPATIEQTAHTHPSTRAGMIARGHGCCHSGAKEIELLPGMIFYIGRDTEHRFSTRDQELDVIAYHPDSDWGPTHEQHPMVNRTWVDGQKIDNSIEKHRVAEIIQGCSGRED